MLLVRDSHYTVDLGDAWKRYTRKAITLAELAAAMAAAFRNSATVAGLGSRPDLEGVLLQLESFSGTEWSAFNAIRQELIAWCKAASVSVTS